MNPILKQNLAFGLLLALSGFLWFQMTLFVAHQVFRVELLDWNLFQYCLSALNEYSAGHNVTKLLFNALIVYTAGRIVLRIVNHIRLSRKWNRIFQSNRHIQLTRRLNYKYRDWNTKIIVVRDDAFIAMTMGLLRPKIIVSSGLLSLFSEREAEAILLHEWHHCRNYDPLKLFWTTLIMDGMGYVPIIRATVRYYKTWNELAADRFAIQKMDSVYDLGNVLMRLSKLGQIRNQAVGAYFAESSINYRIMQVLEPDQPIQVPFWHLKPVLSSLFIFFFMSGMVMSGCS